MSNSIEYDEDLPAELPPPPPFQRVRFVDTPNFTQRINNNREHDYLQSRRMPDNVRNEDNNREEYRLGIIEAERMRQEMSDRQRIANMGTYNREHDRQQAIRRMSEGTGGRTNKRKRYLKNKTKRRIKNKTKRRIKNKTKMRK